MDDSKPEQKQDLPPNLGRLEKLTHEMFPPTDEYGVPLTEPVGAKLERATDLIKEAQATLAEDSAAEAKAAALILNAKILAEVLVTQAQETAAKVVEKAAEVADNVLNTAKEVKEAKKDE